MKRALEPICLSLVALGQVALFTRLLNTAYDFDEGVYMLSLDALRSGQRLGTDVFAAQPPVFYVLLRLISATFGMAADHVRLGVALLSLAGTAGAWFVARRVAGPVAGVLAAGLLTVSPPVPLFAGRILADLPSLWLSLAALALAAVAASRASNVAAAAAGAVAVGAVATKLSAVLAIPVLIVFLASGGGRPARRLAWGAVGASALAVAILIANMNALADLWDSIVTYHRRAASTPAVIDRWASIGDLFNPRTPAFWLVVTGGIALATRLIRRAASPAEIALWGWALVAFVFLATHTPLHYNHLVALPVPLALAAATSVGALVATASPRPRTVAVVALAFILAAGFTQQWRRVGIASEPQSRAEVEAAATLRRVTLPSDFVVADLPVSAVLARRLVPGPLVDTAYLRFETGSLTPATVLVEVDRWCVAAVVAGRSFLNEPAILQGLRERFAHSSTSAGATVLYGRRRSCEAES